MRRLFRWFFLVLGLLLLVLVGGIALLQTGPAKRLLAEQLSSLLSTADTGIEISGIQGWIPLDMRVKHLRLADRDGIWLEAEDVAFDWSPTALLSGHVLVDEIAAARVEVARPPLPGDEAAPAIEEPFRLPDLPKSLASIIVERLAIPEISLGAPILGVPAGFNLQGSMRSGGDGKTVTADLDLKRTDQPTAFAKLNATANLDPLALDLALNAGDEDGMVAALAGRPELGSVALSLEGKGPLEDWSGRFRADVDGLASMEANLGLALVELPRLTIDGIASPTAGSVPDDIAALIGERIAIDLDLVQTSAQALELRKAAVATDFATVDAGGSVNFDQGDLTLEANLVVPDLTPLGPIARAELAGAANATLGLDGTPTEPDGHLDLRLDNPAFEDKTATTIATDIRWTTETPLSSDQPAFDIVIDGQASGVAIPGTSLPDPDISWNGKLGVPLEGSIEIERMAVETAGSSLTAYGAIDPVKLDGSIDLALNAPSLQRLAGPYGQPIEGNALIKASIKLADQAKDIAVDLAANLENLEGLPPGASELLGSQANLEAKVKLDPTRTLSLEHLTADGAGIEIKGQADLDLGQEEIEGEVTLALPDLTLLDPVIPEGAAGRIDLAADLGGVIDAPSADLSITSRDLVVAGEVLEAFGITMNGEDLVQAPNGHLAVDLTARATPLTLDLDYSLTEGTLNLDAIELRAPKTEIGGALAISLEAMLVDGALQGRATDLAALEAFAKQPLGGSIDLDVTLASEELRQNTEITLAGSDVAGAFGIVKTIQVDASIDDVKSDPKLDAKSTITGFEQGRTALDALTFHAQGEMSRLDFELDIAGEALEPLELAATGTASFENGTTLDLKSLTGAFAGEPLQLGKALTFRQAGNGIQLADLDLRLGEAHLEGDLDIKEDTATGDISLRSLPLSWSEAFGGPPLSGVVTADIGLSGSASDPKIAAALKAEDVLAKNMTAENQTFGLSLDAQLDRGRLGLDLATSGVTRKPITATASLPVRLQLQPFAFDMPKDGQLEGKIDVDILLARLADVLALDNQTMEGTLTADIAIGGTLRQPTIQGPVKLEDGGYENLVSGTDIRDLEMTALASNERIDITEFSGNTGKKGTIDFTGGLALDADANFPLALTLRLDEARLVDRDDVEARLSGEVAMTGDLGNAEIKGELTVRRAEIDIPDGGGPNLPELQVTEVGGNIVNPEDDGEEKQAEEKQPFDPVLDLRIKLPNKVYVRGRGLESEWEGDLAISGNASNPVIVGTIEIEKGYFDFLDKRFELERGEIAFAGETPPNPTLAIEAVSEDDDFTAIVKLNGPADDPQLLLSSNPVLPEDEILARLLFNRELNQIGPVEAGKLALAANRLRGGGGFDAFGEIRDVLKIDTLDVVGGEEDEGSRLRAGKYLDDDVYVEVEQGTGEESGRARVEIELRPNIALEADTGDDDRSGIGLKWKFNY
ncbi:MAG: translocation/assembly module TamB domain-containing protein [Geminicoccaceae bacterium]